MFCEPALNNQRRRIRRATDFEIDRWTIEPVASASGGRRSIQLSYGRSEGQSSLAESERPSRRLAAMDLSVAFLGTGGSVPSARRSTASVLVARGGERLLFDCGEGTQRQMQRSLGLVQVDEIYLTHFHADHFLGLPGLLKTYDLTDREAPLTIYGPPRPARPLQDARPADRPARLRARAGRAGARRRGRARRLRDPAPSKSSTACAPTATRWSRTSGPAASTPRRRKRLGVPEGPAFAALQRGEEVEGAAGPVGPEQVMGEARPGRTRRHHRRHRALPGDRRGRRAAPSCSSTTPASPRRRPSAPPRPATRPSARPPRSPARRE